MVGDDVPRPQALRPMTLPSWSGIVCWEPAPALVKDGRRPFVQAILSFPACFGERAIVMWLPEDAPERALSRRLRRQLPFLELRALLEAVQVRVPRLFGALPERGLLVVEDLGETLAERCARFPAERASWYRRAVQGLASAQLALAELPPDCIVRTRAFDRELLGWELEHFREWGVEALGVALTPAQRSSFEVATSYLVSGSPSSHRASCTVTFRVATCSRSMRDWRVDRLSGRAARPRAYDLVALLRDSYQHLTKAS